jgi:[ribosomal protein S18]-alanine N-acetyltransferase
MSAQPRPRFALLRPLRLTDLPAIMDIEGRAYPFPWTEGVMRDCFKAGHQSAGLDLDGKLLGYGWISCAVGEAHILNVAVDPLHQGVGYGRRLMKRLLDVARWYRAEQVFLEVRPSNHGAIQLYRSMGFSQVGLRRGYYPAREGREDALVFSLALVAVADGNPS